MASEMGGKIFVTLLWVFIAKTRATEVNLTSSWKPDLGWEVVCSWKLFANDSLQSVRLDSNKQQFMIYRPQVGERKSTRRFSMPEHTKEVICEQTADLGVLGRCVLTLELYQPPTADFSYACEVSGEGPLFRIDNKELVIEAFVAPSKATIVPVKTETGDSRRVVVNCTAHGLPAPNLTWAIGDQKVQQDFSGSAWNATSKLWDVWSQLAYTPTDRSLLVTCTPEVRRGTQLIRGESVVYNTANARYSTWTILVAALITLALL